MAALCTGMRSHSYTPVAQIIAHGIDVVSWKPQFSNPQFSCQFWCSISLVGICANSLVPGGGGYQSWNAVRGLGAPWHAVMISNLGFAFCWIAMKTHFSWLSEHALWRKRWCVLSKEGNILMPLLFYSKVLEPQNQNFIYKSVFYACHVEVEVLTVVDCLCLQWPPSRAPTSTEGWAGTSNKGPRSRAVGIELFRQGHVAFF